MKNSKKLHNLESNNLDNPQKVNKTSKLFPPGDPLLHSLPKP